MLGLYCTSCTCSPSCSEDQYGLVGIRERIPTVRSASCQLDLSAFGLSRNFNHTSPSDHSGGLRGGFLVVHYVLTRLAFGSAFVHIPAALTSFKHFTTEYLLFCTS